MDGLLKGKKAIVLAASDGIGRAVVEVFAKAGANIAFCARDQKKLMILSKSIKRRYSATPFSQSVDLSNGEALASFLKMAIDDLGGVDILFTNIGGPPTGRALSFSDDLWKESFESIFLSVARSVRLVLPTMQKQRSGSIICLVSSSVKTPIPALAISNTLRPAVVGFAKTVAQEVGQYNIRINCIAPGRIDTKRLESLDRENAVKYGIEYSTYRTELEKKIPLGHLGKPQEIAGTALFLASPLASYITGQVIFVNGGLL